MKQTHRCCNYSNRNRTGSIGGHSLSILTLCVEFFVACRPTIHLLLQHEKEQHHLRIQIPSQDGNLRCIAWTNGSVVTLLCCREGTKLQLLVITNYPSPVLQYFASLPALLPPVLSFQSSAVFQAEVSCISRVRIATHKHTHTRDCCADPETSSFSC